MSSASPTILLSPLSAFSPRVGARGSLLASCLVMLVSGAVSAGAQSRAETSTRRAPRVEAPDSVDRAMRKLQRALDSLTRTFTEGTTLMSSDRQHLEEDLARTVRQLVELNTRLDDTGDHGARQGEIIRLRMMPSGDGSPSVMAKAISQSRDMELAKPRGWIGIVTEGAATEQRFEGGEFIIHYLSYPRIVSVDPASPAERAGLTPGDTLLAYNGRDVRDYEISLTRLLRPNTKVNVRIERDGRARDIPVVVAAVPSGIALRRDDEGRNTRESWIVSGVPAAPGFPRPATPPQGALRATMRAPGVPMAPEAPRSPMAAAALLPLFGFATGVAGAELSTISEGLGKTIGVKSGVLVTRAPVGSLAHESGLRDGDVITNIAGQDARAVSDVRRGVKSASENGDHAVELQVLRQKKAVKVLLKW